MCSVKTSIWDVAVLPKLMIHEHVPEYVNKWDNLYWTVYIVQGNCTNAKHLRPSSSTHWSWVMHICISKLTIIGSDNGLSPDRRQAIIWTNARILLIPTLGSNFSDVLREIHVSSLKKMHWKMFSGKWQQFFSQPQCVNHHVYMSVCIQYHFRLSVCWLSVNKSDISFPLFTQNLWHSQCDQSLIPCLAFIYMWTGELHAKSELSAKSGYWEINRYGFWSVESFGSCDLLIENRINVNAFLKWWRHVSCGYNIDFKMIKLAWWIISRMHWYSKYLKL